jgi:Flp pilus assembly pilin Flp
VRASFGKDDRTKDATAGGQPEMAQLDVFKTWMIAKLGIKDERGANLVEYVFLLAFIALIVIAAVKILGNKVDAKFDSAGSEL